MRSCVPRRWLYALAGIIRRDAKRWRCSGENLEIFHLSFSHSHHPWNFFHRLVKRYQLCPRKPWRQYPVTLKLDLNSPRPRWVFFISWWIKHSAFAFLPGSSIQRSDRRSSSWEPTRYTVTKTLSSQIFLLQSPQACKDEKSSLSKIEEQIIAKTFCWGEK